MTISLPIQAEMTAAIGFVAALTGVGLWLALRKRPTAAELERRRRDYLATAGRIVDGMLLDISESEIGTEGAPNLLIYSYRIAGVDYECSQDITSLADILRPEEVRAGFPCSVRYEQGNPQNSIVVAEKWSGMRIGIPVLPVYEEPKLAEMELAERKSSHLRRR